MNTNYTELLEKAQADFLSGLRQAQDLNVKTLTQVTAKLPTPSEVVERTFAFANELLEARKEYALKLAELADATQQQFVEAAKQFGN